MRAITCCLSQLKRVFGRCKNMNRSITGPVGVFFKASAVPNWWVTRALITWREHGLLSSWMRAKERKIRSTDSVLFMPFLFYSKRVLN
jgi:hypothetical protein